MNQHKEKQPLRGDNSEFCNHGPVGRCGFTQELKSLCPLYMYYCDRMCISQHINTLKENLSCKTMNETKLKEAYDNMQTTRDMLDLIDSMTEEQQLRQLNAHKTVKALSGLDMRQDLFLMHLERA